ncbi:MAG: hypothetical protein PHU77_00125 [Simplicispira sp.]|nr:hypothetical protein [Simplicispira sp.]
MGSMAQDARHENRMENARNNLLQAKSKLKNLTQQYELAQKKSELSSQLQYANEELLAAKKEMDIMNSIDSSRD